MDNDNLVKYVISLLTSSYYDFINDNDEMYEYYADKYGYLWYNLTDEEMDYIYNELPTYFTYKEGLELSIKFIKGLGNNYDEIILSLVDEIKKIDNGIEAIKPLDYLINKIGYESNTIYTINKEIKNVR